MTQGPGERQVTKQKIRREGHTRVVEFKFNVQQQFDMPAQNRGVLGHNVSINTTRRKQVLSFYFRKFRSLEQNASFWTWHFKRNIKIKYYMESRTK